MGNHNDGNGKDAHPKHFRTCQTDRHTAGNPAEECQGAGHHVSRQASDFGRVHEHDGHRDSGSGEISTTQIGGNMTTSDRRSEEYRLARKYRYRAKRAKSEAMKSKLTACAEYHEAIMDELGELIVLRAKVAE